MNAKLVRNNSSITPAKRMNAIGPRDCLKNLSIGVEWRDLCPSFGGGGVCNLAGHRMWVMGAPIQAQMFDVVGAAPSAIRLSCHRTNIWRELAICCDEACRLCKTSALA